MAGYDDFFKQARRQSKVESSASRTPIKKKTSADVQLRQMMGMKKKRKKSNVPVKLVITSILGFLLASGGLYFIEEIESVLNHFEVGFLGHAAAQVAGKPAAHEPPTSQIPVKDNKKPAMDPLEAKVSEAPWSGDSIDHLRHLKDRKRELDLREEELQKMEAELSNQRAELDKRLADLQQVRRDIAAVLQDRVKADNDKVEKLVEFYSNMKPQMASKVFESLDEDLAVEVLGRMKKKDAAEIMNLLTPLKAQTLSEKFAGYKVK